MHLRHERKTADELGMEVWECEFETQMGTRAPVFNLVAYSQMNRKTRRHGWVLCYGWRRLSMHMREIPSEKRMEMSDAVFPQYVRRALRDQLLALIPDPVIPSER